MGGALERLVRGEPPQGACVVTCWDPRLNRYFAGWEGLYVLRLPGGVLRSGRDLVRELCYAVWVKGVEEVIVLAHTDCGLAGVSAGALAEALRKHGTAREAVGDDLRAFVGAFGQPRAAAEETARALRDAEELPASLPVHAALIDTASGRVAVLERGDELTRAARGGGPALPGDGRRPQAGASGSGSVSAPGPVDLAPTRFEPPNISGGYPEIQHIEWAPGVVITGAAQIASSAVIGNAASASAPMSYEAQRVMESIEPQDVLDSIVIEREPAPAAWPFPPAPSSPPPTTAAAPRPAAPPTAQVQRGKGHGGPKRAVVSLEGGKILWNGERPIPDDLRRALFRVRDFYRAEFSASARRDLVNGIDGAAGQGASATELTKIAIRPVLSLGQERYKVINELLAIKEQVARHEPQVAHALLRALVE